MQVFARLNGADCKYDTDGDGREVLCATDDKLLVDPAEVVSIADHKNPRDDDETRFAYVYTRAGHCHIVAHSAAEVAAILNVRTYEPDGLEG